MSQDQLIDEVARRAAVRLQTNLYKQKGYSNSHAKKAAEGAEVNQELIEEAKFALDSFLNQSEAVEFVLMAGEKDEKLRFFMERRETYLKTEAQRDENKRFAENEIIRKSTRLQIDGMRGTNKQVEWALKIREKVILLHGVGNDDFEELARKIKSAPWWIDNKNLQIRVPFLNCSVADHIKNAIGK